MLLDPPIAVIRQTTQAQYILQISTKVLKRSECYWTWQQSRAGNYGTGTCVCDRPVDTTLHISETLVTGSHSFVFCPQQQRHSHVALVDTASKNDTRVEFRRACCLLGNPLTPKDKHSGRTAPLTSKRCIFNIYIYIYIYIYSTNIATEYFKHGIYLCLLDVNHLTSWINWTNLMSLYESFLLLNMFRMLLHSSSGAGDCM